MNETGQLPTPTERPFGVRSLLNPRLPFSRLAGALMISSVGDPFSLAVSLVIVYGSSHSPLAIGAAYGCRTIAALLVGGLAGSITDRLDRRWLLIALDGSRFLILLLMPPLVALTPLFVFPCLFLLGGAESLAQPARLAGAVVLAPPGAVERANSLMMVSFSIAQAVGFAIAGTLLTLSRNATYVYWIDSATFLAAALLALTLPSLGGGIKTALVRASGLKQLARAALRPLLLVTAGTNLLIGVGTSTMLPLAYSLYREGAAAYTWLEVALIVGLVGGSLLISRWGLFGPATAMTIAVVVFGLAALGIAATSLLAVALVSIAITGAANAVYSVRNRAALMRKAGPDEQGSIMSTRYSAAQGSQIVGLGIGAVIVQYAGPRTSFLAVGLGMLAVGGLFSLHLLRQRADAPVVEQGR